MVKDIFAYMEYLGSRYSTGLESFEKIIKSKLNISLDDLEAKINDKILSDVDKIEEIYEIQRGHKGDLETLFALVSYSFSNKETKEDTILDFLEDLEIEAMGIDAFFKLDIRPLAIAYKKNIYTLYGINSYETLKDFLVKEAKEHDYFSHISIIILYNILVNIATPPTEALNIVFQSERFEIGTLSNHRMDSYTK